MATSHPQKDSDNERRILLIGKTGAGKSTTGNTILGFKAFKAELSFSSCTSKTEYKTAKRFGKKILVVDTPGLSDTEMNEDKVLAEISRWYTFMSPGIHAILLVIQAERYTKEEEYIVGLIQKAFGDRLKDFLIVVFANKDKLTHHKKTLDEFIDNLDKSSNLYKLIQESNRRYVSVGLVCGTKENREEEVQDILSKIDEVAGCDGNNYYSNEYFIQIEEMMKETEEKLSIEKRGAVGKWHRSNIDIRDEIRDEIFTETHKQRNAGYHSYLKTLSGISLILASVFELVQMYIRFKHKNI